MATVNFCSDFAAQENKVCHCFHCFLIYLPRSNGTGCPEFYWMLSFKPAFSLSSFTFTKRLFSYSSLSAIWMVLSAYLRLLIFLLAILIPACASSNLAFCMMYSAYKLNKQGDNIHPWHSPFPIWNQSDLWRAWYILGNVLRARGGGKEDPKRNVKWLLFCRSSPPSEISEHAGKHHSLT